MKKKTFFWTLAGLCLFCYLFSNVSVRASQTESGSLDQKQIDAGKLKIDWQESTGNENQTDRLTLLEQLGIEIFIPEADSRIQKNKRQEKNERLQVKSEIFLKDPIVLNTSVSSAKNTIFLQSVSITTKDSYTQKKDKDQPPNESSRFLLPFLTGAAFFSTAAGVYFTRKNRNKNRNEEE